MAAKTPPSKLYPEWSEARVRSFITSALRQASKRWPPACNASKKSRTRRGFFVCAICKEELPTTVDNPKYEEDLQRYKDKKLKRKPKKRINNKNLDHRDPVVSSDGFVDWNTFIERLFISEDGYDDLCNKCHQEKTNKERELRK